MKRFALALAACVLFAFAACDNKNNEITAKTFAEEIAGTYNGYSTVSFFNKLYGTYENQNVVITANENGTVNLLFADDSNDEWKWGKYELKGLSVTKSGNIYHISGENNDLYVGPMSGKGDPMGPYSYSMEGNIVSATDAKFVFVVAMGGMGDVTVEFTTGTVPDKE